MNKEKFTRAGGTFLLSPPPTLTYANGCGVNAIGTWTNLIKFWLILQHIAAQLNV